MPIDPSKTIASRLERVYAGPLGPLALLAISVPFGVWWFFSQMRGSSSTPVSFDAMAACFVILAMAYLGLHGLRNMAWTSLPVLLTFEALAGFVAVPAWQFATGADTLDSSYELAMFLVLIAFAAFWLGSAVLMKEKGLRFSPSIGYTSGRVLIASVVMLVLGGLGKFVLWKFGLFGYGGDDQSRGSYSGILAWLTFMSDLLGYALVVSAIEVLGKRSPERAIKVVFWLSFLPSIGFGIISGMKSDMLTPIFDVILIYGVTRRQLPRITVIIPVVLILVIYPFTNAFRENLNVGYRAQFNTLGGMKETLVKSFDDAFFSFGAASQGATSESFRQASNRVSYLTYVRDVSSLPNPSMLQTDEKIWMAPLYALVPRFLWKSKPIMSKGGILSVLVGRPGSTSSAVTPIGDLYSANGTWGVAIGMLIWGLFVQLSMNWIGSKPASERMLFAYLLMLRPLLDMENDFTTMIAAAVQMAIMAVVISYAIYGRSPFIPRDARGEGAFVIQ